MQSRSRLRVQDDINENSTLHPIALGKTFNPLAQSKGAVVGC